MTDKKRSVELDRPLVEVTISAPADEVWRALREPAAIQRWFGWDADTLEKEIEVIFIDYARASESDRTIYFEGMSDRIELEARGSDTVVRIVRPAPTADTDWDEIFEDETQGWIAFVNQLRLALERHAGERRRTLYFSGSPREAGSPLTAARLGLPAAAIGERYAIETPVGDQLAGEIWHRGRHQIGVTVDGWGEGLLVVMDRPPCDRAPTGTSQAILTTYGLSDPTFADLEERWTRWWNQSYGASAQPGCS